MKYTISQCVDTINQMLNYPSVSFEDIAVFFDQAVAELNTSLHIQIKPISYLRNNYTKTVQLTPLVKLTALPTASTQIPTSQTEGFDYYYDTSTKTYKVKLLDWSDFPELYAVLHDPISNKSLFFKAVKLSENTIFWGQTDAFNPNNYDLTEILPVDWIVLYLIPYVCFKQTVRDGSNGALFADEFTQGFQQLQNSYDIPSLIPLNTVAHLPAYLEDVQSNLAQLYKAIPPRAITQDMLHSRSVLPEYGNNFDNGGWGI